MKKPFFRFIILAFLLSFLAGCGENIFSNEEKEPSLDNARTPEQFNQIINQSETVIEDENSTDEQKQEAYVNLGLGYVGLSNMNTLELVKDLSELSEVEDGDEANAYNLIQITASQNLLVNAADAFNLANAKACGDDQPDASSSCNALTEDDLLNRAVTNMYVVVSQVNQAFDVSSSGNVTPLQDNSWQSLNTLLTPIGSSLVTGQEWTITDYADQSIDSFEALETFTEEQIDDARNIRIVAEDLEDLQEAVSSGGSFTTSDHQTFTFTHAYDENDTLSDEDQAKLDAALDAIFASINK